MRILKIILVFVSAVIVVVTIIATPFKHFQNQVGDKGPISHPCMSSTESKRWNIYICSAEFRPKNFRYHGHEIVINEAWMEKKSKISYFLVWFPYRKDIGGYQFCFTLAKGGEIFRSSENPFFALGNEGHGFGTINSDELFYETLETKPSSLRVSLLSSFNETRSTNIEIKLNKT